MTEGLGVAEQKGAVRRIVRNAASILLGDAAGDVLTTYAVFLALLHLGPKGFGTLSAAQAVMDPFEALAGLGLANVAVAMAASRGGCDGTLRGTIQAIRTVSAVCAACVGISAGLLSGRGTWPLLLCVAIGMLTSPTSMVSVLPFQYTQTVHRRIALPFVIGVVRLGTAYLAVYLLNKPIGYQLSALSAAVFAAVLNRLWARRVFPDELRFDRSLALKLLRLGWPAAVLEFTVMVYKRASIFLLNDAGPGVQGTYAAADRLLSPVLAIAAALFVSSLPTIAQLAAQGEYARLKTVYVRGLLRVTAGLVPLVALAWLVLPWLLRRFAPDYNAAYPVFCILSIGTLFMFLNVISTSFIVALGKFRTIMVIALVNLAVYLALATRLIPGYGAPGAALATSTMEAVNTLMQIFAVYRLLSATPRPNLS